MRKHVIELPPQAAICVGIWGDPHGEVASSIRGRGSTIVPLLIVPLVTVPLKASSIRGRGGTIVVLRLVTMAVLLLLLLYIVPLFSVPLPQPLELRSATVSTVAATSTHPSTQPSTHPSNAAAILFPLQLCPPPCRGSRGAASASHSYPEGASVPPVASASAAIPPAAASASTGSARDAPATAVSGRCSEVMVVVVLECPLGRVPVVHGGEGR